jgi:streptogramin lyase
MPFNLAKSRAEPSRRKSAVNRQEVKMSKKKSSLGSRMKSALHCVRGFAARALLAGLLAAGASVCQAQTNILEFSVPSGVTIGPYGITSGADGAYWFTEYYVPNSPGLLGRIDTVSNVFTQYNLLTNLNAFGTAYAEPFGICLGPNNDTNLWFTEYFSGQVGRITTNGTYTEYPLTNGNSSSNTTITPGPDGNLWFVEYNLNRIAAFNPAPLANITKATNLVPLVHEYGPFGTNTTYLGGTPGTNAYMNGLVAGPDGNMWFTLYSYGNVGKLNPATGAYTLYPLPSGTNSGPWAITAGVDGALWFTELASNNIGRITTSGQVTEFPIPLLFGNTVPEPYSILATADSNIWFTEYLGSAVCRMNPTGVVTVFPTLTVESCPFSLATGPDSNIWFTEYVEGVEGVISHNLNIKNIGRLLVSQSLNLTPAVTNLIGTNFNGVLATYQNSVSNNAVTVYWGDGNYSIISVASLPVSVTNIVFANSHFFTNSMTITQTVPIDTNNDNGTFVISVNHTYSVFTNFAITLTVSDPRSDTAIANLSANSTNAAPAPAFIGEHITNGALVLSLNGQPGKTYSVQSTPGLNPPVWTTIGSVTVPPGGTTVNFTNTISPSSHFFRLSYP